MSEVFEGILYRQQADVEPAVRSVGKSLAVGIQPLGDGLATIYDKDPRATATFSDEMERVAARVSEVAGSALLVRYDSRVGHRSALLYERGQRIREFGPSDERWAPLDEHGLPRAEGPTYRLDELDPDEEYDTVRDAIQLGLEAFGTGTWDQIEEFIARN